MYHSLCLLAAVSYSLMASNMALQNQKHANMTDGALNKNELNDILAQQQYGRMIVNIGERTRELLGYGYELIDEYDGEQQYQLRGINYLIFDPWLRESMFRFLISRRLESRTLQGDHYYCSNERFC